MSLVVVTSLPEAVAAGSPIGIKLSGVAAGNRVKFTVTHEETYRSGTFTDLVNFQQSPNAAGETIWDLSPVLQPILSVDKPILDSDARVLAKPSA